MFYEGATFTLGVIFAVGTIVCIIALVRFVIALITEEIISIKTIFYIIGFPVIASITYLFTQNVLSALFIPSALVYSLRWLTGEAQAEIKDNLKKSNEQIEKNIQSHRTKSIKQS